MDSAKKMEGGLVHLKKSAAVKGNVESIFVCIIPLRLGA